MESSQKAPIGRPRGFDADEALEQAMLVFWKQGYEGASLTDLTNAMGITRKSMYAAFGNKEELFRKALARYTEGPASYASRAMEKPTAREVATAFLTGSVGATTRPGCPMRLPGRAGLTGRRRVRAGGSGHPRSLARGRPRAAPPPVPAGRRRG